MKNIFYTIVMAMLLLMGNQVIGQEVTARLDEAETAYHKGSLEDARFALKQALNELDQVLGKEILAMLPTELKGVPYIPDDDNVTGNAMGYTGMYVNRTYRGIDKDANIELIDDSPLIASINAILQMPAFMTGGDPNQKRIKIHGYKALMNTNVDDSTGIISYDIQIPFNKSLLTFRSNGFDNENTVLKLAESIPLDAIVRMTK